MANPEHLAILKQGVELWNKWRDGTSRHDADLRAVDLSHAGRHEADLSGQYLQQGKSRPGGAPAGRTLAERISVGRTSAGQISVGRTSGARIFQGRA